MLRKFPFFKYHWKWIGLVFLALVSAFVAENGIRFSVNQTAITALYVVYGISAVIAMFTSTYYVGRKTYGTRLEAFGWSILMFFNAGNAFAVMCSLVANRDSWLFFSGAVGVYQSWIFYRFLRRL